MSGGTITRVSSQLFLSKVKGNRSPDTIKLFVLAVSTRPTMNFSTRRPFRVQIYLNLSLKMEREDSIRGRKGKGGKGVLELQFFFVS